MGVTLEGVSQEETDIKAHIIFHYACQPLRAGISQQHFIFGARTAAEFDPHLQKYHQQQSPG